MTTWEGTEIVADVKGKVLPVYFVADESFSMADSIGQLNQGLTSLLDAINTETMAAAKVRMSVIGFADTAQCYLSLADLREVSEMPKMSARGGTSYRSAFDYLLGEIPNDARTLKSQGYQVHRPAVFFLTDGLPTDDGKWESALASIKSPDFHERPNLLAFGIGKANAQIIAQVASQETFAFQAAEGVDTGIAITKFLEALTHSIVSSGNALADDRPELVVERPEGFTMVMDTI